MYLISEEIPKHLWFGRTYEAGEASPTWLFSDEARDKGADAMLYSSRSRPELSHVVIFDTACLSYIGPITAFETDEEFAGSKGFGNTGI